MNPIIMALLQRLGPAASQVQRLAGQGAQAFANAGPVKQFATMLPLGLIPFLSGGGSDAPQMPTSGPMGPTQISASSGAPRNLDPNATYVGVNPNPRNIPGSSMSTSVPGPYEMAQPTPLPARPASPAMKPEPIQVLPGEIAGEFQSAAMPTPSSARSGAELPFETYQRLTGNRWTGGGSNAVRGLLSELGIQEKAGSSAANLALQKALLQRAAQLSGAAQMEQAPASIEGLSELFPGNIN